MVLEGMLLFANLPANQQQGKKNIVICKDVSSREEKN